MKGRDVVFSKGKDDWQTPKSLFDELNAEFYFTLDVAASGPNLLPRWLGPNSSIALDALTVPWTDECCFMNPPYSMVAEFIHKAYDESRLHHAQVLALVPSRTDTRWWHNYVWDEEYHQPRRQVWVRFIRGRVKFVDPTGYTKGPAPFPSAIIIFGI